MDIAQKMLMMFNDDIDLLKKVITGNESWVHDCDVETKGQLFQWKHPEKPRPEKARQVRSNVSSIARSWCIMNS